MGFSGVENGAGDGTPVPSTKRAHGPSSRPRWSAQELQILRAHPDMTSGQLARLLPGRTPAAVRHMRMRAGRWGQPLGGLCICCDARPVWEESARAQAMRLCKGCYIEEMGRRLDEQPAANALRQKVFKKSPKRGKARRKRGGANK